jgi:hypothetical protein
MPWGGGEGDWVTGDSALGGSGESAWVAVRRCGVAVVWVGEKRSNYRKTSVSFQTTKARNVAPFSP